MQFAHGPDGNLYVIDMYRQLIEGIQWVPPEVVAKMDPTAGSDRGRIYRIVPDDFKQPPPVRMGQMSTESLVEQLAHRNGWRRDTAARLLYERQDQQAVEAAAPAASRIEISAGPAARAVCAGRPGRARSRRRDSAASPTAIRACASTAVRLAEQFATVSADVEQQLLELIDDTDIAVRLQLAFSLGSLPRSSAIRR